MCALCIQRNNLYLAKESFEFKILCEYCADIATKILLNYGHLNRDGTDKMHARKER